MAQSAELIKTDSAISNPPYNLRWEHPAFGELDNRFTESGLPPESNANFAFVMTALNKLKRNGRLAVILPCGVLSSSPEEEIREYLSKSGKIESIIQLPDRMFESTSIPVCILTLTQKRNEKIVFIDARNTCEKEIREQRGGMTDDDKSHRARIYKKEINVLLDDHIQKIESAIKNRTDEDEFSHVATIDEIIEHDYNWSPSRYIGRKEEEQEHRPYKDIAHDLWRINKEKNKIKLTINETLARQMGIDTTREMLNDANDLIDQNNKNMQKLGINLKLKHEEYLTLTKSRVLKIENVDKEAVSSLFMVMVPGLIAHIHYLNEEDNRLLCELRDALLPELMSGKIRVPLADSDGE